MALVKCPECGKENVSENAESCPNCGYGIKKYFDELKRKGFLNEKRNNQLEELRQKRESSLNDLEEMSRPNKPKWSKAFAQNNGWLSIIALPFFLVSVIILIGKYINAFYVDDDLTAIYIILIISGLIFLYITHEIVIQHNKEVLEYKDWESVKKEKREKIELYYAEQEKKMELDFEKALKDINTPAISVQTVRATPSVVIRCPKCGSTTITTGARGVNWSHGLIGASKTVNRCANCGYTWLPKKK